MVLERDEVEVLAVGEPRELHDLLGVGGVRRDEDAEAKLVSVVRQTVTSL